MSQSTRRVSTRPPIHRIRRPSPVINLDHDSKSGDSDTVDTAGNSVIRPRILEFNNNNNEEDSESESDSSSSIDESVETISSAFTSKPTIGTVPPKIEKRKLQLPVLHKQANVAELRKYVRVVGQRLNEFKTHIVDTRNAWQQLKLVATQELTKLFESGKRLQSFHLSSIKTNRTATNSRSLLVLLFSSKHQKCNEIL